MKTNIYMQTVISGMIAFLLAVHISPAQKPNLKFRTINQSDGLANSTVQDIFEDSFGLIWLGTHQGVQRFNGNSYTTYVYRESDSSGLSSNYISGFCEDIDKNIWIASNAGLNQYIRKTDKIKRYTWDHGSISELGEPNVLALSTDADSSQIIWMTAVNIGIIKLNVINDSYTIYPFEIENFHTTIWMLPYPDNNRKLLLGGTHLYSFDKKTGKLTELLALEQNQKTFNNSINDAAIDPRNNSVVWLATGDYWGRGTLGGIIRFDLNTGEAEIFSSENRNGEIIDKNYLSISFQGDENLWIGTRMNGVLLYRLNEDRFYSYMNNDYDEGSFVTKHAVRSILLDRSGTCWFGTWGDGISLLSPAAQKFVHYKHLPGNNNDLPGNYINSFTEDKHGNIWIGTEAGGISCFDPDDGSFKNYYQEFSSSGSDPTVVLYLYYDSRDQIWIGTYDNALHRFDPSSGKKYHYKKGPGPLNVSQKRISAIAEFEEGKILFSTYGGGLSIYDYKTNTFRQFLHDPDDSTSIPDNQIWLPFVGEDNKYYFSGNSTAGLISFDPLTEQFNQLTSINITAFMMAVKTSTNEVYIDDFSYGLRKLSHEGDEFIVNTVYDSEGNCITNIESIVLDEENDLWISTGNGLIEFDPDLKKTRRYDISDGLQGNDFNRLAGFTASDGAIYFGGYNGFNVFHPGKISLSAYKPPVVFTDFRLFQESVSIGDDSPLQQNILLTKELILDHSQNDFSISFAALDYTNPERLKYKYKLENHDNEWVFAGHNNTANYTNMDPGKYTFKVIATNSDGIWKEEAASIRIIINPPWWQTNWAYLCYGLLFIAGVILVDRIQRKRLIEKEKAQAREKELAQAKEIEKAYTKLKSTQEQLLHSEKMASLGELTAGIAHEIQNPLNFVNNFSEVNRELIAELKEEIKKGNLEEVKLIANDIDRNEKKISHHGIRADGIVKGMLQHSRTAPGEKEDSNINLIANEYLRLSYHGLRAKDKSFNADFITDFDKSIPLIPIIPQDIGRVLLNLINNAFHAVNEKRKLGIPDYKPLVTISSSKNGNKVIVSIKDNGGGISEEYLEKIFQPFFTTKPAGEGTGLGLSISYDIIKKGHGGNLDVKTKAGEGTEFIIVLPSTKQAL